MDGAVWFNKTAVRRAAGRGAVAPHPQLPHRMEKEHPGLGERCSVSVLKRDFLCSYKERRANDRSKNPTCESLR